MPTTQVRCFKSQGKLGVSCIDNPTGDGAMVSQLCEGSRAGAAGLKVGDVVSLVNGIPVFGHRECIDAIDREHDLVAFTLSRERRLPSPPRASPLAAKRAVPAPPSLFPLPHRTSFSPGRPDPLRVPRQGGRPSRRDLPQLRARRRH